MNVWKRYPYLNAPLTAWSSRQACQGSSSSTHGETKVNVALEMSHRRWNRSSLLGSVQLCLGKELLSCRSARVAFFQLINISTL